MLSSVWAVVKLLVMILSVDTEDNSQGTVLMACFYGKDVREIFFDQANWIRYLDNLSADGGAQVWATNLEYDICNLFQDKLDLLTFSFGRSKMISCRYKKVKFLDTYCHWRYSVARMGEMIGLEKLPFKPEDPTYCMRDAEITYKFTMEMLKLYEKLGAPVKGTLPSSALGLWETKYCTGRYFVFPENDAIKPAYYGGRSECFQIGTMRGTFFNCDINSMYPHVMCKEFPNPNEYYLVKNVPTNEIPHFSICRAKVKSDLKIPVLPYRLENSLVFPNGNFSGWWTGPELNYAISQGVEVKNIDAAYIFPNGCSPFVGYVDDLYSERKKAKDSIHRECLKLFMNSLYGKFGQGRRRTYLTTLNRYLKRKKSNEIDVEVFGDKYVLYQKDGPYPRHTQMAWAAFVTSYARILLHECMSHVIKNGGELMYCDTDSVIYRGDRNFFEDSNTLGEMKLVDTYQVLKIKKPKEYWLEKQVDGAMVTTIKTKGVPKAQHRDYFLTGRAVFRRPIRLKEGLRRGLQPNVWQEFTKEEKGGYRKGIIEKNGRITPLKINRKGLFEGISSLNSVKDVINYNKSILGLV